MTVVAKFQCTSKTEHAGEKQDSSGQPLATNTVDFTPVQDDVFGPWTPSGSLSMTIVGKAADAFKVGDKYLLTFEHAPS